ncbi:MAG: energy transducer TonB [Candidatus Acidiferrales bacterium]
MKPYLPASYSVGIAAMLCGIAVLSAFGQQTVPISDVASRAVALSQLTLPGSSPFHLKAAIVESTNPDSDYKADVEEYWLSSTKWRRTIESPHFSQTLVVSGDSVFEQDKGDYYPFWLHDLVTAIFEPLPMLDQLEQVSGKMRTAAGGAQSTSCSRLQQTVGLPPTQMSEFSVFCFEGSHGLLDYVVSPGYDAEFKDYKKFNGKFVARRIVTDPEPGTTIEARITLLDDLSAPSDDLFSIQQPTPQTNLLRSVRVDQAELRNDSVSAPAIVWPTVRDGKTSGALSLYVSVDRDGHVRETWPLNSDNARLDDSVRAQVMKWQFKPVVQNGVPVQADAIFTFAFDTGVANAVPILSDAEARALATNIVEATVTPGTAQPDTAFTVRISIGVDGKLEGVENINKLPDVLFLAGYQALTKWHFKPYVRDGKPDEFKADITFHVR